MAEISTVNRAIARNYRCFNNNKDETASWHRKSWKKSTRYFQWLCKMSLFRVCRIFCLFSGIVYLNTKKTSVQNSNCEFYLISAP